jgi:hypothetical protein
VTLPFDMGHGWRATSRCCRPPPRRLPPEESRKVRPSYCYRFDHAAADRTEPRSEFSTGGGGTGWSSLASACSRASSRSAAGSCASIMAPREAASGVCPIRFDRGPKLCAAVFPPPIFMTEISPTCSGALVPRQLLSFSFARRTLPPSARREAVRKLLRNRSPSRRDFAPGADGDRAAERLLESAIV